MSNERTFLHDIATPLSLIRLNAKRLQKSIAIEPVDLTEQKLIEQIINAVSKIELLHADRKASLTDKD